ncbi:hypothetical protein VCV18_003317 [Metarhizium anisopliae]
MSYGVNPEDGDISDLRFELPQLLGDFGEHVVDGLVNTLDILEKPVQGSNNLLEFLVCLGNRRIERLHILLDRGAGGAAPAVDGGSDTAIVVSLKVPELADCALCLGPQGSSLGGVEFDGGSLVERGIRHGYGTSGQCGSENGEKTGDLHSEIRFFRPIKM